MALSASQLKVGDTHEEQVVDNLTRTQIVQYAGASGDYNPIHSDEVYSTKVAGYPSVFAHGMLSMGIPWANSSLPKPSRSIGIKTANS